MMPSFIEKESIDLERLFAEYRANPALVTSAVIRTFGEIRTRLGVVVAQLKAAGIREGDTVALHGENGELHLYLFLAAWVMGFLYVPLDFKAPLDSLLDNAPFDFLIAAGEVPPCTDLTVVPPEKLLSPSRHEDLCSEDRPWPAIPFRREAGAIFTSGSTGKPRGIVHTVGNYLYSALGTNEFIGLQPADRWLLSLPLFHVGGVLIWVRTLLAGSVCILPETLKQIEDALRTHHPSLLSVVPTQLIRLLASEDIVTVLRKTKAILLGGAPSPAWLIEKALDLAIPIVPSYGSTESCTQATGVAKGSERKAYFTAGEPLPYREVRIGSDGTILLGGKTLFQRYLDDPPGATGTGDRFFPTADVGYFDQSGNLVVLGRKDGIFISGGENISPFEIENALLALDAVATAIAVPVPHREFGLVPWAFVERLGPFNEQEILVALKSHLPGYKVPKRILPLQPQDKEGTRKYSREALTKKAGEMAAQERGDGR